MKKILSGILITLFFSMTFLSCGLDTFYFILSPIDLGVREIDNSDLNYNYVRFKTNEIGMPTDFEFDGTCIYYKIFATKKECEDSFTIINLNNNDSNYEKASTLVTTKYSQLKYLDSSNKVDFYLIRGTNTNKTVEIRLINNYAYGVVDSNNMAYVKINNVIDCYPVRFISEKGKVKLFDFGWRKQSGNSDTCALPETDDVDFDGGTLSQSDSFYYIDLYAIALGRDTTTKTYYSRPLHLGVIKVNPNATSNNWSL